MIIRPIHLKIFFFGTLLFSPIIYSMELSPPSQQKTSQEEVFISTHEYIKQISKPEFGYNPRDLGDLISAKRLINRDGNYQGGMDLLWPLYEKGYDPGMHMYGEAMKQHNQHELGSSIVYSLADRGWPESQYVVGMEQLKFGNIDGACFWLERAVAKRDTGQGRYVHPEALHKLVELYTDDKYSYSNEENKYRLTDEALYYTELFWRVTQRQKAFDLWQNIRKEQQHNEVERKFRMHQQMMEYHQSQLEYLKRGNPEDSLSTTVSNSEQSADSSKVPDKYEPPSVPSVVVTKQISDDISDKENGSLEETASGKIEKQPELEKKEVYAELDHEMPHSRNNDDELQDSSQRKKRKKKKKTPEQSEHIPAETKKDDHEREQKPADNRSWSVIATPAAELKKKEKKELAVEQRPKPELPKQETKFFDLSDYQSCIWGFQQLKKYNGNEFCLARDEIISHLFSLAPRNFSALKKLLDIHINAGFGFQYSDDQLIGVFNLVGPKIQLPDDMLKAMVDHCYKRRKLQFYPSLLPIVENRYGQIAPEKRSYILTSMLSMHNALNSPFSSWAWIQAEQFLVTCEPQKLFELCRDLHRQGNFLFLTPDLFNRSLTALEKMRNKSASELLFLADLYEKGVSNYLKPNKGKVFAFQQQAAKQGHFDSQLWVAQYYFDRKKFDSAVDAAASIDVQSVEDDEDREKALTFLRKLAEKNSGGLMFLMEKTIPTSTAQECSDLLKKVDKDNASSFVASVSVMMHERVLELDDKQLTRDFLQCIEICMKHGNKKELSGWKSDLKKHLEENHGKGKEEKEELQLLAQENKWKELVEKVEKIRKEKTLSKSRRDNTATALESIFDFKGLAPDEKWNRIRMLFDVKNALTKQETQKVLGLFEKEAKTGRMEAAVMFAEHCSRQNNIDFQKICGYCDQVLQKKKQKKKKQASATDLALQERAVACLKKISDQGSVRASCMLFNQFKHEDYSLATNYFTHAMLDTQKASEHENVLIIFDALDRESTVNFYKNRWKKLSPDQQKAFGIYLYFWIMRSPNQCEKKEVSLAKAVWGEYLEKRQDDIEVKNSLATIENKWAEFLQQSGKPDLAADWFKRAYEKGNNAAGLRLAKLLMNKKTLRQAVGLMLELQKEYGDSVEALVQNMIQDNLWRDCPVELQLQLISNLNKRIEDGSHYSLHLLQKLGCTIPSTQDVIVTLQKKDEKLSDFLHHRVGTIALLNKDWEVAERHLKWAHDAGDVFATARLGIALSYIPEKTVEATDYLEEYINGTESIGHSMPECDGLKVLALERLDALLQKNYFLAGAFLTLYYTKIRESNNAALCFLNTMDVYLENYHNFSQIVHNDFLQWITRVYGPDGLLSFDRKEHNINLSAVLLRGLEDNKLFFGPGVKKDACIKRVADLIDGIDLTGENATVQGAVCSLCCRLANQFKESGNIKKAWEYFEKGEKIDPYHQHLIQFASFCLKMKCRQKDIKKNVDRAIQILKKAAEKNPAAARELWKILANGCTFECGGRIMADKDLAEKYLGIAIDGGDEYAINAFNKTSTLTEFTKIQQLMAESSYGLAMQSVKNGKLKGTFSGDVLEGLLYVTEDPDNLYYSLGAAQQVLARIVDVKSFTQENKAIIAATIPIQMALKERLKIKFDLELALLLGRYAFLGKQNVYRPFEDPDLVKNLGSSNVEALYSEGCASLELVAVNVNNVELAQKALSIRCMFDMNPGYLFWVDTNVCCKIMKESLDWLSALGKKIEVKDADRVPIWLRRLDEIEEVIYRVLLNRKNDKERAFSNEHVDFLEKYYGDIVTEMYGRFKIDDRSSRINFDELKKQAS